MFIRLKLKKMDIIKNVEKIDSIWKSTARLPSSMEDLQEGIENTPPSIKIQFTEEVGGSKGTEIIFSSVEARDAEFDKMSEILDAKLFSGK